MFERIDPIQHHGSNECKIVGQAFAGLLHVMDGIVAELGCTEAARAIVSYAAREVIHDIRQSEFGGRRDLWEFGMNTTLSDVFLVSRDGFDKAGVQLKRQFSVQHDLPILKRAKLSRYAVVIRGHRMYLEAEHAAVLLGHCYEDSYGRARKDGEQRWSTAVTKEAEILLDLSKMSKPAIGLTHSKSSSAAIKSLVRVAAECFKVNLQDVTEKNSEQFGLEEPQGQK